MANRNDDGDVTDYFKGLKDGPHIIINSVSDFMQFVNKYLWSLLKLRTFWQSNRLPYGVDYGNVTYIFDNEIEMLRCMVSEIFKFTIDSTIETCIYLETDQIEDAYKNKLEQFYLIQLPSWWYRIGCKVRGNRKIFIPAYEQQHYQTLTIC